MNLFKTRITDDDTTNQYLNSTFTNMDLSPLNDLTSQSPCQSANLSSISASLSIPSPSLSSRKQCNKLDTLGKDCISMQAQLTKTNRDRLGLSKGQNSLVQVFSNASNTPHCDKRNPEKIGQFSEIWAI